ncbi:MAG: hypothetical protein IRZ16_01035 [Myxococcaceae bacterium]|nr:hypothetical protein [Myxococcaceae bacterium]
MKGSLGFVILIVGILAGSYFAYRKYNDKAVELEKVSNLDRIQRDYLERVSWIRSNPDMKAYKDEVGTFFRWYFKEINEHQNRFGGNKEFDDYLKELETRSDRLNDNAIAERKKVYETVKAMFDAFRQNRYDPVFSATDDGMRFDIVSADVKMVGNEPKIHLPIILWGAQRELRDDGKMKRMVTSASFSMTWRLFDAKGKLLGEMTATGDPSNKIDYPERYIAEFPPQMVLGEYDIDLLPAEVARIEAEFAVTSRSPSGGEAHATYTWKLDAPSEWKLKEGEQWKGAQEDVRPLEEIDPAAAAKAAHQ